MCSDVGPSHKVSNPNRKEFWVKEQIAGEVRPRASQPRKAEWLHQGGAAGSAGKDLVKSLQWVSCIDLESWD